MAEKRNNAVGPHIGSLAKQADLSLQRVLVFTSWFIGLAASTQMFAHTFEYQEILGHSLNHLYAPWDILIWSFQYYAEYPAQLKISASMGIMLSSIMLILTLYRSMHALNKPTPNEFMHGSARWANESDIRAASLLDEEGVYVGAWIDKEGDHKYLMHNGPEHVLCFAPTRSGKGVGLVIPTLLSWQESAVILDLKGELWELTSGYRKSKGHKVLRFDPANPSASIKFNPLEEIRLGTQYEVGDVQNLATLLVDPDGKGLTDHWQKTAQSLLVGVILHLLYKSYYEGKVANLPALDSMLSDPKRPIHELWKEMTSYKHKNDLPHPSIEKTGRDMIDRPEDEAGSVLSTAKSYLSLYRDPVVAKNVSKSEFKIQDLVNHERPVSLYIVTHPNDKTRLRPLIRIVMNLILRKLADKIEFKDGIQVPINKHKLLMMLDEFASLGKLEILQESLAYIAGYGIKCYIIVQDISQLKNPVSGYGAEESITSNCHIQVALRPNRLETAQYLSDLTGDTTIIKEQISTSSSGLGAMDKKVTRSMQEVRRPLLTVDECMRLAPAETDKKSMIKKAGKMVIYCAGFPAIMGEQPLYFQHPEFLERSKIPAPKVTDKLTTEEKALYPTAS